MEEALTEQSTAERNEALGRAASTMIWSRRFFKIRDFIILSIPFFQVLAIIYLIVCLVNSPAAERASVVYGGGGLLLLASFVFLCSGYLSQLISMGLKRRAGRMYAALGITLNGFNESAEQPSSHNG